MANTIWHVDPSEDWRRINQEWLLEANVPGTERCDATLSGKQCELKAGHTCAHILVLNVLAGLETQS